MFIENKTDQKLGVLGGGQLGRMLIQEAINFNISVAVIDPDSNAPCADLATEFFIGDLNDFQAIYEFGNKVDIITIEIENVNVEALEKLESEGKKVYPPPAVLKMIKDKGLQKAFYKENGIPTADFFLVDNKAQIEAHSADMPFMQKLRNGGYDGRGVTKITDKSSYESAFDAPSVLEKFVDFEKEIAVIAARNESGEVKLYPAVEMQFNPDVNLVEFLFTPASISDDIEKSAQHIAAEIVEKTSFVGLLAVEFFVTRDGKLLVNEIAPRPHNSGHQSIEANYTSQSEQHLRAIFNLPLGSTRLIEPAVMINLLGSPGFNGEAVYEGLEDCLQLEGVFIHLYGKKISKPFRKMGHVTIMDKSLDAAKEKALFVQGKLKVKTN